jgi:hypothetical protein
MSTGLTRASVFAIKEESTVGEYLPPSSGTDYVALRPGNTISFEPEALDSDELLNDIGAAKSFVGKEAVSGSHPAYLRHSGVEGQEPQLGLLWESLLGTKNVIAVEHDTIGGSTINVIKVGVGEGALHPAGSALLIKDATNGYSIRNVLSVSGDDLTLNFSLSAAPAAAINLGKAITYIPAASGHPTFSTTKYLGNGHAIEASAGNTTTQAAVTADANGFGTVEFSFEGTKYFFNPITITASSKFIDFTDDDGTFAVSVPEDIYNTPVELADAIAAALNGSASTEVYTCTYNNQDGKFTIATSTSSLLSLLWNTGANTANSIKAKIGYNNTDDTGSLSYASDNAQTYAAPHTPSYDSADAIIIKGAELFVGSQDQNVCVCAQSVSITISKTVEDVDCVCEESGVSEKIPTARTAEMQVTATLNKYDAKLLDALLKNSGIAAMLNAGPKVGGNWAAGKCANFYMQNCTVSAYTTTGDNFIQAQFTLKGFVTSTGKDIFVNFV